MLPKGVILVTSLIKHFLIFNITSTLASSAHYTTSGAFSEQTNLCDVNDHAVKLLPLSSPLLSDALLIIRIRFPQLESNNKLFDFNTSIISN